MTDLEYAISDGLIWLETGMDLKMLMKDEHYQTILRNAGLTQEQVMEILHYVFYEYLPKCDKYDMITNPRLKPMKVLYRNRHGDGYDLLHQDIYSCPSCHRRLRHKQPDNFCSNCGQNLIWEI